MITVELVDWSERAEAITSVRMTVFVDEQNIPAELEMDGQDAHCQQVLARDETGRPVGTGRIQSSGKIERMGVLKEYRGRGIGGKILQKLIEYGQSKGIKSFKLTAQTHAIGFYAKYGFVQTSDVFDEVGIPHVSMQKE